jgi:hypothetical protein
MSNNDFRQRTLDDIQQFLWASDRLMRDARFLLNSIPNVDMLAVQRVVPLLESILGILNDLEDPDLGVEDIASLTASVQGTLTPLRQYRDQPEAFFPAAPLPTAPTYGPGRPMMVIDLSRTLELHTMGNSWQDVADAMGVTRQTLYYHLNQAGIPTARKPFTEISDDDLDGFVAAISLEHPLSGRQIVKGHLESLGIHLSDTRVMASLHRVDPIGVMLRCVIMAVGSYLDRFDVAFIEFEERTPSGTRMETRS